MYYLALHALIAAPATAAPDPLIESELLSDARFVGTAIVTAPEDWQGTYAVELYSPYNDGLKLDLIMPYNDPLELEAIYSPWNDGLKLEAIYSPWNDGLKPEGGFALEQQLLKSAEARELQEEAVTYEAQVDGAFAEGGLVDGAELAEEDERFCDVVSTLLTSVVAHDDRDLWLVPTALWVEGGVLRPCGIPAGTYELVAEVVGDRVTTTVVDAERGETIAVLDGAL